MAVHLFMTLIGKFFSLEFFFHRKIIFYFIKKIFKKKINKYEYLR